MYPTTHVLFELIFGNFFLIVLVVGAGGYFLYWRYDRERRRRKAEGLQRLLDRDPSLRPTLEPCGLDANTLAGSAATPRGDRRFGYEYAISGPIQVQLDGQLTTLDCAAFRWWHEERRTSNGKNGRRTQYVRRNTVVAGVRVPCDPRIDLRISSESMFGRLGLTRGGQQLESSEFNRRFRVDTEDRTLAVHLLDAGMQRRLLEEYAQRAVHLRGSLLLLGGTPSHRDTSLPGVIGELPAVRQDLWRLLDAVPAPFWRAAATDRQG